MKCSNCGADVLAQVKNPTYRSSETASCADDASHYDKCTWCENGYILIDLEGPRLLRCLMCDGTGIKKECK